MAKQDLARETYLVDLRQDQDFWFEDGSVVVIAQTTAFRVHRSVLSRHSDTFSGLFSIPQPASPESLELIDGCPVVRVANSAHDFLCLFRALYDGANYLMHDKRVEFSELAALARLGHKYQLDNIVAGVCGRLATVFSLDSNNFNPCGWEKAPLPINIAMADAVEALNLFRLLGREDMIPVALYACCQLSVTTLIPGIKRADGTCEQLSSDDLQLCLAGREALTSAYAWRMFRVFNVKPNDKCSTPENCARHLNGVSQSPATRIHLFQGTRVLSRLTPVLYQLHQSQLICKECQEMLVARDKTMRRMVWEQVPKMLNLKVGNWPPFEDSDW
ncbi:hypothetical protein V8D89_010789 [Ganoderma adspersum]